MDSDLLRHTCRYRWGLVALLGFAYALVYFQRQCPAVLAVDMMVDLEAGGFLTGLLAAAYFYPYAVLQIPAGLLADSWGPRKTITASLGIAVVGSVLFGIAPTISWAIAGRALAGVGLAMVFVPATKIFAEWFEVARFPALMAILVAMGGTGVLLAGGPLAVLSSWMGWRVSLVVSGGLTMATALLVWRFARDRPSDLGWPSPAEHRIAPGEHIALGAAIRAVVACPWFWPLALWFFLDCGIFFAFGALWGGPYMMHIYGLSKAKTGSILSMLAVGMIAGSPLFSVLTDKVFRARKPVLVLAAVVVVGLMAFLYLRVDRMSVPGLFVFCFLFGAFSNAIVVIAFTAAKELFPVQIAGTATGFLNLFPFLGGAAFQPILGAILAHHGKVGDAFTLEGYRQCFLVLLCCAVGALAATLFVKETLRRR